jgi:TorA maturation chaperone TorD
LNEHLGHWIVSFTAVVMGRAEAAFCPELADLTKGMLTLEMAQAAIFETTPANTLL